MDKTKNSAQAFDGLNVSALYDALAEILSAKHGATIRYTVERKKEARAE